MSATIAPFGVRGPLPLNLVGIVAAIADPLAAAGMSIFVISTYDTDYVLVKARELDAALQVLRQAGHRITRTSSPGSTAATRQC